ncbi:MAG: HprK-related kinase B [Desulfarculus sp.]|nr:HprK-related kinase B [Desulfarculus sp.]
MNTAYPSLEALASAYLAGRRLEHGLSLRFGQCRLRLDSNSLALVHTLREYFRGFQVPDEKADIVVQALEGHAASPDLPLLAKEPDPGKPRVKEEYRDLPGGRLVRKRLTGMVFLFGGAINLALGPCLRNDNQVVNFINSRYIQWLLERGHLLCHAAAVGNAQGGLALAGFSGMGKSTLALHLMSRGLDFVSNDRLLIKPSENGLAMHGVAKLPRINPGTALTNPDLHAVLPHEDRELYQGLAPANLWTLERKYDVFLDRCFGHGRFKITSGLRALVILNWRGQEGGCRLAQVDLERRPDLLGAVMKSPGLFYLPPTGRLADVSPQTYLKALASRPTFELTGSPDFTSATEACLELLSHGCQDSAAGPAAP